MTEILEASTATGAGVMLGMRIAVTLQLARHGGLVPWMVIPRSVASFVTAAAT